MITTVLQQHAHEDVDEIFEKLLPRCGMKKRPEQIRLCHTMLDAMCNGSIALSDADTGTGKIYAYLVAGIVYDKLLRKSGEPRRAITVSTATVALQKAIHEEYVPFLSEVLLDAGCISEPILSVVRKGRRRYVCDRRWARRIREVRLEKKNKKNAEGLLSLRQHLDMDEAEHLSDYDRRHVCVPKSCRYCESNCRYQQFLFNCMSGKYLFQICNHNLLLADARNACYDQRHILEPCCALIVDEAHKLSAAARQMFGRTFGREDVTSLAANLKAERYRLAAQKLVLAAEPILDELPAEDMRAFARKKRPLIRNALKTLYSIRHTIGGELTHRTFRELADMTVTLELLADRENDVILYADEDEQHHPVLCAAAADYARQLERTLWPLDIPILLTSGTVAVGNDFSRFRNAVCLGDNPRVMESVFLSPFDYENNCLLYIPCQKNIRQGSGYYERLAENMVCLLKASSGHALALFNSYTDMSSVLELLDEYGLPYPLYAAEKFKQSGNGVLLAAGAAWEGMDFPGDMVSLLMIPRLHFPIPDAFSDYRKEQYGSLREFIEDVAVPDMQIRLRQGFGRAIRLETDACVVAILDERASRGGRYHTAVLTALPLMPVTGSVRNVERFFRSMKDSEYFGEDVAR